MSGPSSGPSPVANRGGSWTKIGNNLPTVAIHEFAQHPATGDLIVATHGRSIWVLDAAPIRQLTKDALKATVQLYAPPTANALADRAKPGHVQRRGAKIRGG